MAKNNAFLLEQNQTFNSNHTTPNSNQTHFQKLESDSTLIMERGPKYDEYSALRNKRLKSKISNYQQNPEKVTLFSTPPIKKQVKFQYSNFTAPTKRPKSSSVLTQSVPDFSSALRKENRKPKGVIPRLPGKCVTPPLAGLLKRGGVKSTNALEKRSGGMMGRKSFASVVELNRLGFDAGNAINGGGKIGRGFGKSVLGNIQF